MRSIRCVLVVLLACAGPPRTEADEASDLLAEARRAEAAGDLAGALERFGRVLEEWPESEAAISVAVRGADFVRRARYARVAGGRDIVAVADDLSVLEGLVGRYLTSSEIDVDLARQILRTDGVTPALLEAIARWAPIHPAASPGIVRREVVDAEGGRRGAYFVAVPDSYDPGARWPVLVYLHGTDGTEEIARASATSLARAFPGHLVVAPAADRLVGWGPNPHGLSRIESTIETVRREFAIDPDRIAITGYSMGGHGTWDYAIRHPSVPSAILPQAGTKLDTLKKGLLENLVGLPIRFLHGEADGLAPVSFAREMDAALQGAGVEHAYREFAGVGHLGFPQAEVSDALRWVAAARRPRLARRTWAYREPGRTLCDWIRVDQVGKVETFRLNYKDLAGAPLVEVEGYYEPVVVRARIEEGQVILEGERAKKVTILLHPSMVDLQKAVVVKSGGRVLFSRKVAADPGLVLESLRRDAGRPYRASVTVTLR